MKLRRRFFSSHLGLSVLLVGAVVGPSCSSIDLESPAAADPQEPLGLGEICETPSPTQVRVRAEPSVVFVPTCASPGSDSCVARDVNIIVDPDFCTTQPVRFEVADAAVAAAPVAGTVKLHHPTYSLKIAGLAQAGATQITVRVPRGDGTDATATIDVNVLDPVLPDCEGSASLPGLKGGDTLSGETRLAGASVGMPEGANTPNNGSFLWHVDPFDASIACAADIVPNGYTALGPAITFGPETSVFKREINLSVPVNPALMPEKARFRHVRLAYTGPTVSEPHTATVADPHFDQLNGQWALTFKAPRLGTYQAVMAKDAGTKTKKRRLTHRAVVGVSMGGGGTAMFGLRNHHLFDVLAPLGGPVDWTYMLNYIENNHLGGFRPILPGTQLADIQLDRTVCSTASECQPDETCEGGKCALFAPSKEPYAHPQTFNTWWYEYPRAGNGGRFPRDEYAQIFRDLALMFGNPNGDNLSLGGENLPAGVRPDDPSQLGDHPGNECSVWVDPLDGPDKEKQDEIAKNCPAERCSHPLTLLNYFDDEYNPDGTFPVITVCDGSEQQESLTPYANTWQPTGNNYPLEVGLAVDYNGNGVRDEMEPIIRAGHEPWDDVGVDGIPSVLEAGYELGVNEDPAGDDYDPQFNPTGTEGDFRYELGEPFKDVGLDGVAGTAQQPAYPQGWQSPGDGYDVGEGDGKFTVSRGLATFWERDSHSVVRQTAANPPSGSLTEDALSRIDLWTDGGTRDLFNFSISAQHLIGAFAARGRDTVYYTDFVQHPGLDRTQPNQFVPPRTVYEDMQGIVMQRYGQVDPDDHDIEAGSGQHVGTANEIASRLQAALYFIGSRWNEPEIHERVTDTADDPVENIEECWEIGNCTFDFTSSFGRKGVVGVSLPPGYGNADQQERRYPVIYMLHGYGQTPDDLEAAIVFLRNWMNSPADGMASRLPKAILVYVDGRCRADEEGTAECIRGSFFTDSVRETGVLAEQWWLELIDHIDGKYRTMGESEVDWTE